jgi:hypothetical protein
MGRAHQQLTDIVSNRDPFTAALGSGRGLTCAQLAERARVHAAATAAKPFHESEENGGVIVSYYQHNDPDQGLHREDGPARITTTLGGARIEEWWLHGKRRREGGPAIVTYHADGSTAKEEWYQVLPGLGFDGVRHRSDGPAVITNDSAAGSHSEEWWRAGKRHRDAEDGPAVVSVDNDYSIIRYQECDQLHREDGPAVVEINGDSGQTSKTWYRRGKHNCENGPAFIRTFADGARTEKYYDVVGRTHRVGAPAVIHYRPDGTVICSHWFRRGHEQSSSRLLRFLSSAQYWRE